MEDLKNNSCPSCGVEFNQNQIEIYNSFKCPPYNKTEHDFKYRCLCGGDICWWCATRIPGGLIDVIFGTKIYYSSYNKENFREYHDLQERIKFINNLGGLGKENFCPRCGKECIEKSSENLLSNENFIIKKCLSCGWC